MIGLADFDLHIRDLKVDAGLDEWRIRSQASLQASAPGLTPEFDEDDKFDSFDWNNGFGIPGYGLGFDLGGTYSFKNVAESASGTLSTILSNLSLSVALTDIGFISWNKKNNNYLYSTLEDQVVTGNFVIDFDNDNSSLQDDIDNIKDTFEEIIEFKEGDAKSRTTGLRTNLNIALEYEILKDLLSAGVISTTRFNAAQNITETTLAVTYRPVKWFEGALSYSFIHSKFNTFGLVLNFNPTHGVHFFLASDYIIPHVNGEFLPVTSRALNFQMGLSIPMGARKKN